MLVPRATLLHATIAPLALAVAVAAPIAGQSCDYAIEYGMNPSFQTWSARGIVFADAMARVRVFELGVDEALVIAPTIPLGAGLLGEGWPDPTALGPGQKFSALMFGAMQGTIPDGRNEPYVIVWDGTGVVEPSGIMVTGEANRTTNRVEFYVDPTKYAENSGLSVRWTSPDPADPVRNVHVWLPGTEGTGKLFWPPYLDKVRQMNHGRGPASWRTLDWTRVNDHGAIGPNYFPFDLTGRITPRSPSQGTLRGVCPEFQVAFCNELGIDLHFQVPHRGEMSEWDYLIFLYETFSTIRYGAPAVPGVNGGEPFKGLDPSLTLTIELSNEIWNSGFPVNKWMIETAAANGRTVYQQIASQIELVFDVADGVFAGADGPTLRKFIGGQLGNKGYLQNVVAALRPGLRVDAMGPAAYFGPRDSVIATWEAGYDSATGDCPNCPTPAQIVSAARDAIPDLRPGLVAHRTIVENYTNPDGSHPAFVLYEAGQSFKGLFRPWQQLANTAQVLPELFEAYAHELVPMLVAEGVELVHWYSFMTNQDPDQIAPYGIWNDMNQTLELPVAEPYVHAGMPKAAAVYLGPPLVESCPLAQVVWRNAGTNPDSYDATRPVLGSRFRADVDLTTTGHALAFVFSYSGGPAQVPVGGGMTLLTAGGSPSTLILTGGPVASVEMPIPADPALAGQALATQALHVGGAPGFALSNAQDLVLGR